jgi:hypothetical protein
MSCVTHAEFRPTWSKTILLMLRREIFGVYGEVASLSIICDPSTNRPKVCFAQLLPRTCNSKGMICAQSWDFSQTITLSLQYQELFHMSIRFIAVHASELVDGKGTFLNSCAH